MYSLGGIFMKHFNICIRSFADIRDFVAIAIAQPFDVFGGNDIQKVNAKSLMAMFTLNYHRPLQVSFTCDDEACSRFTSEAAKFIA